METLIRKGVPSVDYYSDYQIKKGEKRFYVHKVILALKSEKFDQIFQEHGDYYEIVEEDEEIYRLFLCQFYIDAIKRPVIIKEHNKSEWKIEKEKIDDIENKAFESIQLQEESKMMTIDELFGILRLCEEYRCIDQMHQRCQYLLSNKIDYRNYQEYLQSSYSIIKQEAKRIEKLIQRAEIKNIIEQINNGNRVFCKDDKLFAPIQSIGINCRNNCGCGFTAQGVSSV